MSTYARKAEVVEAVQFHGDNYEEMHDFAGTDFDYDPGEFCVNSEPEAVVFTRTGGAWETLFPGDWVVKHSDGFEIVDNMDFVRDYVATGARIK